MPSVSFDTIEIQRKLPIINGFVQPPDGQTIRVMPIGPGREGSRLNLRNSLTPVAAESAVSGSFTRPISGNLVTDRDWYILPAFKIKDGAPADWWAELREAAS